jgi:hypothetical protein
MFPSRRGIAIILATVLGAAAYVCGSQTQLMAQQPEGGETDSAPLVETTPMTLKELTEEADKIFRGKVAKVETQQFELTGHGGKKTKVAGRVITFDVEQRLKGDVAVGHPLQVRQVSTAYSPLKVGDEVLWYLDKPGPLGFTAPLGVYSANFKIKADPQHPQAKVVVNLANNIGLWSSHQPLFDSTQRIDKSEFAKSLESKRATLTSERAEKIMQVASEPNRPGPLPLELVESGTESLLPH